MISRSFFAKDLNLYELDSSLTCWCKMVAEHFAKKGVDYLSFYVGAQSPLVPHMMEGYYYFTHKDFGDSYMHSDLFKSEASNVTSVLADGSKATYFWDDAHGGDGLKIRLDACGLNEDGLSFLDNRSDILFFMGLGSSHPDMNVHHVIADDLETHRLILHNTEKLFLRLMKQHLMDMGYPRPVGSVPVGGVAPSSDDPTTPDDPIPDHPTPSPQVKVA